MIAWMLYVLVVTAVVALAARAAETLARCIGLGSRWIWSGALVFGVVLAMSSALRVTRGASSRAFVIDTVASTRAAVGLSGIERAERALAMVGRSLDAPMRAVADVLRATLSPALERYSLVAWLLASFGIAAMFVAIVRRFARLRASWPRERVCDVDVRVSPTIGPVALGIFRPEIVVPRWLLERCREEQELAVAHEREHLRVRDPLLIAAGWSVVVLMPWNAALWYMMSRLRLAIEVDCDARVLRRGASPRAYGTLLIDVAHSASPLGLGALTLANASHLHERIVMLRPESTPFRRLRAAAALPCAAAGLLVACQATVPAARPDVQPPVNDLAAVAADSTPTATKSLAPAPTIFINGVRSTWDALQALDRSRIETVDVLKGAAAIAVYSDDARNGVIVVRTKDATKK